MPHHTPRRTSARPTAAASLFAAALLGVWGAPASVAQQGVASATAPASPDSTGRAAGDDANPPGPPLPPDFKTPPEKPQDLYEVRPLIDEAESEQLRRDVYSRRFNSVIKSGPLDDGTRKLFRDWADWQARKLTMAQFVDDPVKLREEQEVRFLRFIRSAGTLAGGDRQKRALRAAVFDAVTQAVRPLLENHILVRLQAIYILSELDLSVRRDAPQEGYGPAIDPLLGVVADENMTEPMQGVKTFAVRTIAEILTSTGEIPGDLRLRTGEVLAKALRDHPEARGWYQSRLASTLPLVGVSDTVPLIAALTATLNDESRPFVARAAAAAALTRIGGLSGPERDGLPGAIRALTGQMASAYNENPTFELRWAFVPLYLALHVETSAERNRLPGGAVLKSTSLPGDLAAVERFVTPIVAHVRGQDPKQNAAGKFQPIPAALLNPEGA